MRATATRNPPIPAKSLLRRSSASLGCLAVGALVLSGCSGGGRAAQHHPTTTRPPATTTTQPPATTTTVAGCVPPPAQWADSRLAEQLVMVIGQFTALPSLVPEAATGVGGFALLGAPSASQGEAVTSGIVALVATAKAHGQAEPLMATTTEGGPVSRLANILGAIPSARQMAATMSATQVESLMATRGAALRGLGITMDLAPVLDIATATDPVADEGQRSFSATPHVAAAYGTAFALGLKKDGVLAVGKHFPGLGHASADTDTGPATDPPLATLEAHDLIPFEQAVSAGIPAVMVGHAVVPNLTGGLPASLSPATYRLLRNTLHFQGVVMTDSLVARAITSAGYTEASAAVTAIESGADLALVYSGTWHAAVSAIESALSSGALPAAQAQASVTRILAAKGATICGG